MCGQYRVLQRQTLKDWVRTGGAREIRGSMACVRETEAEEPQGYRRLQHDHRLPHERESSSTVCLLEGTTPHTVVNSGRPFPTLPALSCPNPPPWSRPALLEGGKQVEREAREQAVVLCPHSLPRLTGWGNFQWNGA